MKWHWIFLLLFAIALPAAIPAVVGGIDAFSLVLEQLDLYWLSVLGAVFLISIHVNVVRYRMLLTDQGVTLKQLPTLGLLLAVQFFTSTTPGGSGGPFAAISLMRRHAIAPSVTLSVLATGTTLDVVTILTLLLGALFLAVTVWTDAGTSGEFLFAPLVLLSALALLWLLARHHRLVVRLAGRWASRLGIGTTRRIGWARQVFLFRDGIRRALAIPPARLVTLFLLCAVAMLLHYSIIFLTVQGLGGHISWLQAFLIQVCAMVVGRLFLLPGGAGGAEATAFAMMVPVLGTVVSAAAILVWRFMAFHAYLLLGGGAAFLLLGRSFLRIGIESK